MFALIATDSASETSMSVKRVATEEVVEFTLDATDDALVFFEFTLDATDDTLVFFFQVPLLAALLASVASCTSSPGGFVPKDEMVAFDLAE